MRSAFNDPSSDDCPRHFSSASRSHLHDPIVPARPPTEGATDSAIGGGPDGTEPRNRTTPSMGLPTGGRWPATQRHSPTRVVTKRRRCPRARRWMAVRRQRFGARGLLCGRPAPTSSAASRSGRGVSRTRRGAAVAPFDLGREPVMSARDGGREGEGPAPSPRCRSGTRVRARGCVSTRTSMRGDRRFRVARPCRRQHGRAPRIRQLAWGALANASTNVDPRSAHGRLDDVCDAHYSVQRYALVSRTATGTAVRK